ncbi:hypothetical protein [Belliella calami]|uniref:hypothetical protein n=1 Tax=Belliella calami TaxID=2923436 RepID=UPI001F4AD5FD|nr:hypothetical protein [Belliella calami]
MKPISIINIILLIFCVNFSSCTEDSDNYKVEYKVYSNKKDIPIRLSSPKVIIIKDYWEYQSIGIIGGTAQIEARCDDQNVLITCEIYINGKLKSKMDGNGFSTVRTRIE